MKNEQGLSLVELVVAVLIIAVIVAISIPTFLSSRRSAFESATIGNLRTLHTAQSIYYAAGGNRYGTFDQLSGAGLLDNSFTGTSITKSQYTIAPTLNAGATIYCARATTTMTGARQFGIDQTGIIYQSAAAGDLTCTAGDLTAGGGALPIQ